MDLLYWQNAKTVLPCRYWTRIPRRGFIATSANKIDRLYVIGRYGFHASALNGILRIYDYGKLYPTERIWVLIQNYSVHEIELKTLAPDEIPKELADPEKLIRELGGPPEEMSARVSK